jgi:AAT family amino acid transporter
MDNWPGWRLVKSEAPAVAEEPAAVKGELGWTPTYAFGLAAGIVVGVGVYFLILWTLPVLAKLKWVYT